MLIAMATNQNWLTAHFLDGVNTTATIQKMQEWCVVVGKACYSPKGLAVNCI